MIVLAAFIALLVGGFATAVVALLLIADRLRASRSERPHAEISGQSYSNRELTGAPTTVIPRRISR